MVKCRTGNRNAGMRERSLESDRDWMLSLVYLQMVKDFLSRERQDNLILQSGYNTENNM